MPRPYVAVALLLTICPVRADWVEHRETMLRQPGLVRFYSFGEAASLVANLAGPEGTLRHSGAEPLAPVAGRWPGRQATRLDKACFEGPAFPISANAFTVSGWLRKSGIGSMRGNAGATNGTLFSAGTGYWDGWRITTGYPERISGFEIGRPKPSSSVGLRGASLADGAWQHLAATWDGRLMRLYHNGLPVGEVAYTGEFTPPADGRFRVGYAGFGWGSVLLDVDEVAVFNRALTARELLIQAHLETPLTEEAVAGLEAADKLYAAGQLEAAARAAEALIDLPGLHPELIAAARIRLARALLAGRQPAAAAAALEPATEAAAGERYQAEALSTLLRLARGSTRLRPEVLDRLLALPDLADPDRRAIRLAQARHLAQQGSLDAARGAYLEILTMDLSAAERLSLRLELAHATLAGGETAAAQADYRALAESADTSASQKALLYLRLADTWARERAWGRAAIELARVEQLAQAAPHLRTEAVEKAEEFRRLAAGKPARDPAASRVNPPPFEPGLELHVAPGGRDDAPGTVQEPLATLDGAREAVRRARRGGIPRSGIAVTFGAGEYPAAATVAFSAEDSGSAEAPIVYRAAPGAAVRFRGGQRVDGFGVVTDPAALARMGNGAAGRVVVADLGAQGITELGSIQARGYGYAPPPTLEVFFNGRALRPAGYPNSGFLKVEKVINPGSREPAVDMVIEAPTDRVTRWGTARDALLYGYWKHQWADETLPITRIDPATRQISARHPRAYGVASGARFRIANLLEELDEPGECYVDRQAGRLYLWPPSDPSRATIEVSLLREPFVTLADVTAVRFEGLTFELGQSDGIAISGGADCLLAGCTLRQLAGTAITVRGGRGHGILSCDLSELGRNGTAVSGGDRKTLTPGGHFIANCQIHHFSRLDRTYTPAVWLDGVGNRVTHNRFHDSPCHALRVEGNDHRIEFNEVFRVVLESDDQGGLDMWGNPTYRGNLIRHNYWHDIGGGIEAVGQAGIRLDDAISGTVVYGNIFARTSSALFGGVQIHGGKDNWIDNNLFVDCQAAVSFSPWGEARWGQFLAGEMSRRNLTAVDITRPPYQTRYAELGSLDTGADANWLWRNVAVQCGSLTARDRGVNELLDNLVVPDDPFANAGRGDFRLKPQATLLDQSGFRPIPFEEIGLYVDRYRPALPKED